MLAHRRILKCLLNPLTGCLMPSKGLVSSKSGHLVDIDILWSLLFVYIVSLNKVSLTYMFSYLPPTYNEGTSIHTLVVSKGKGKCQ